MGSHALCTLESTSTVYTNVSHVLPETYGGGGETEVKVRGLVRSSRSSPLPLPPAFSSPPPPLFNPMPPKSVKATNRINPKPAGESFLRSTPSNQTLLTTTLAPRKANPKPATVSSKAGPKSVLEKKKKTQQTAKVTKGKHLLQLLSVLDVADIVLQPSRTPLQRRSPRQLVPNSNARIPMTMRRKKRTRRTRTRFQCQSLAGPTGQRGRYLVSPIDTSCFSNAADISPFEI